MAEKVGASESTIESLELQLQRRERQLNSLTGALAESQSAEERVSKSAATLALRDRQLNALTGQLAQLASANDQPVQSDDNAETRIDELSAQLSQLESAKGISDEQLRLEQEKGANALAMVADRDRQIQSLQEALEAQKAQLDQTQNVQDSALTELNAVLSSHQQNRSQLLQLKTDLKQQKGRHESELANLKRAHQQELLEQTRETNASFHSTRIELKHYQRLLSESEQRGAQWKERANTLEQNQAHLETQLKQVQTELQQASSAHRERVNSLEKAAEQAKLLQARERAELEKQLQANQQAQATSVREQENGLPKQHSKKSAVARKPSKAKGKPTVSTKRESTNRKSDQDDLTLISGIGPVAAKKLNKLEVKSLEQISQWTAEDVKRFSEALSVGGRIKKEKWVQQAKKLAR